MADFYQSMDTLTDIFWEYTIRLMDLDPVDSANAAKVRKGWPAEGAPSWKRTENVAFITVTEDDDPINKQVDVVRTPNDVDTVAETSGMTRVLSVSWVFYGPTSYDTAFHIKRKLFQSSYNSFLAPYKIYLVPSIKAPVRIPEIYAGQYWERTDLKVQFNSLSTFDELIAYIKSAEFKIVNNRGEEKDVFINTENNS